MICLSQSNIVCAFLPPAPCSCSYLSSPPVAAFPLAKSLMIGLKTNPNKIFLICLTREGSCLLTWGQIGHRRLYRQIFVEWSASKLSAQIISPSLICFPKIKQAKNWQSSLWNSTRAIRWKKRFQSEGQEGHEIKCFDTKKFPAISVLSQHF